MSVSLGGVAAEVIRAENDFERAAATDQMWEAFRKQQDQRWDSTFGPRPR